MSNGYCMPSGPGSIARLRGNHLSNTTCLTYVFFTSGTSCSNLS